MFAAISDFGRAALIAGYIMLLHSFYVKVHADTGYFSLALILVCKAVHASAVEPYPILTLPPQSRAACFKTLIILFLSPFGDN